MMGQVEPKVVFVDVVGRDGCWACPWPTELFQSLVGSAFSSRHRPVAYVVEDGFRLFIPTEPTATHHGWVKRSLTTALLDENHPLGRLHDALMQKTGPAEAPPSSCPRLPLVPEDSESDESLLILVDDCWMTRAGNTRPIVAIDDVGNLLYSA